MFFMKFINFERKGNFKQLKSNDCITYRLSSLQKFGIRLKKSKFCIPKIPSNHNTMSL